MGDGYNYEGAVKAWEDDEFQYDTAEEHARAIVAAFLADNELYVKKYRKPTIFNIEPVRFVRAGDSDA